MYDPQAYQRRKLKKQLEKQGAGVDAVLLEQVPKPSKQRASKKPLPVADEPVIRKVPRQDIVARAVAASTKGTSHRELEKRIATAADEDVMSQEIYDFERENYRSRFFIPNVGQEKAILPLKTIDINVNRVIVGAFTGGNMVGKTTCLASLAVGMMLGKEQLNPFFDDWTVFEKFRLIREIDKRPIMIRIVCHRNNMMADGAVYKQLNQWFPKGWLVWSKNQMSYFSSGEVRDPLNPDKLIGLFQVRTHDQDALAHAGDTVDAILCDEPMPQHLYMENVSRLRGSRGGILWFFCTPLEIGGWMKDWLEDDPDAFFTSATIWDNCSDYHPDPRMWSSGVCGVGEVLTRGHIPRSMIEDQLREWRKDGPEVALSRETGKFTHLSGAILKEFSHEVHVMQNFPIPKHWPIYCVMDPHFGGKPSFIAWFAHAPSEEGDRLYLVAEHPGVKWDQAGTIQESVQQACKAIRDIEAPFRSQVMYRFCDPVLDKIKDQSGKTTRTMKHLWSDNGIKFQMASNDTDIGLTRLRELLFFEKTQPFDPVKNCPRLRLFDCNPWTGQPLVNVAAGMTNWTWKKGVELRESSVSFSSAVTQAWKDPVDVCRYLGIELRPWRKVENLLNKKPVVKQKIVRNPMAV